MANLTYRIGDVRVYLLSDGPSWADGGGLFGVVPRVMWEKILPPDAQNRVPMEERSLLIESSQGLILVDTGHGAKLSAKLRGQMGLGDRALLLESLAEAGYAPEDVRMVVNTHLHADHCGGNTMLDADGRVVPTFPNAIYLVQRLELADATYPNERTRNTYFPENFLPLRDALDPTGASRLRVLSGDTQLTPEVRVQVTPGHTRSHQAVVIESRGETGVFLADVSSLAVNMERLAWVPAYDTEPLVNIETKRSLRDWAWRRSALLFFQHDTDIPAGYMRPDGDRWRVEPAER